MPDAKTELSLTTRTARGAGWVVGWRLATRLLGTISTLLLVRLLVPGDFGLVAIATTFSQAVDGLADIGVDNALIREPSVDRAMYDTGFTLALIRGLASSVLIALCAWPVGRFFGDSRLAGVLLALAVVTMLSAVENIGVVDFQRDLAFDREFKLLLAPRILGIIACVTTAYIWRSYWALVVGILTTRLVRLVCTYLMHDYRPRLSLRALPRLVGFSFWSWMLAWVSLIRDRIDNFVVGRMLGAADVGLYAIAWDVGFITFTELVAPICRALFPGLTHVRNQGSDIADAYFRAISATLVVTLPAGAGIALVADPLIRLAVGERWAAAIPLVQIFAIVGIFRVVTYIGATLLTVFGILQIQFSITLSMLLARFALLVVLIHRFGLVGVGYAVATVAILEEIWYLFVTFRRFGLRPADLLRNNWRPAAATAVMAGAVVCLQRALGTDATFTHLLVQVAGGGLVYAAALLAAWLAAGQPRGAESAILAILRDTVRGLQRRRA
jgi:lipopolysaccharide exporter